MEEFKQFDQIYEPDLRRTSSVTLNLKTNEIFRTRLEDLYNLVKNLDLDENVPNEIRSHFQIARNLFIYSWFFYPFSVTAQFHALISIEYALQTYYADRSPIVLSKGWKPKPFPGFKSLIKRALDDGRITDEGFSQTQMPRMASIANSNLRLNERPEVKKYCEVLVEALPILRNDLAHGSSTLHDQGIDFLIIALEFINQLFSPITAASVK